MQKNKNQNEKLGQFLVIVLGSTILWAWIGFIFLSTSSLYFIASILIGLWLGLLVAIYEIDDNKE
jgi:hypothetical protein